MIGRMACLLGRVDFIIFANKRQNVVRLFGRRSRPGGEVRPRAGGLPSELQGLPTARSEGGGTGGIRVPGAGAGRRNTRVREGGVSETRTRVPEEPAGHAV